MEGMGEGPEVAFLDLRIPELQFFAMRSLERVNAIFIIWCA